MKEVYLKVIGNHYNNLKRLNLKSYSREVGDLVVFHISMNIDMRLISNGIMSTKYMNFIYMRESYVSLPLSLLNGAWKCL